MSDFIRMYGCKMSHRGICRKCKKSRDTGDHTKCDRWPGSMAMNRGFTYVANSEETTLAELKRMVAAVCGGDPDNTPVRFELRIRQTGPAPENVQP